MLKFFAAAVAATLLLVTSAQAQTTPITVTNVTAPYPYACDPNVLCAAPDNTAKYGYADKWRVNLNDATRDGLIPAEVLPTATIYFAELSNVKTIEIWNYLESNGVSHYGAKEIKIELTASPQFDSTWTAVDGVNSFVFTDIPPAMQDLKISTSNPPSFNPADWTGADWSVTFDTCIPAQAVRIMILTTHGGSSDRIHAGLCQVDFFTCDVPEPATMTLLAMGGLALLRRRK